MKYTLALFIVFPLAVACLRGQTNCYFIPDKDKIVQNKNLNYFLKNAQEPFKISYDKKDIPGYVGEQFNCLTEDSLLANPNEEYNSSDVFRVGTARRQLVFHAINSTNFIIVYHMGGIALFTRALFMRFSGEKLIDVWSGSVDEKIKNLDQLVIYIQKHRGSESEFVKDNDLNSNEVSF